MACSSTALAFTDGPVRTVYTTGLAQFQPRKVLSVGTNIGPISMAGDWAALATYAQSGEQLTPLASWTVYGVEISSGRVVKLAIGSGATQLGELPYPTVGDGFIVWDQMTSAGHKILWRYDVGSGATTQVNIPAEMFPVRPSAAGAKVLFLDNNRDPAHASEVWLGRSGEPILLDGTGQITHLTSGSLVAYAALTPSRAVWISQSPTTNHIQDIAIPGGTIRALSETTIVAPLLANNHIAVWFAPPRGAVTVRVGDRTSVASPDLDVSPGGMALCGSDLYYGGPNLSLRVAHIG